MNKMNTQLLTLVYCISLVACGNTDKPQSSAEHRNDSPSTSQSSPTDDIAGLRIGMSPQDARAQLIKINPQIKISELRDNNWNALIIKANQPAEMFVLEFTETDPKVWFVGRTVAFPKGKRPLREDLRKELIVKYGQISITSGWMSIDYFDWAWKSDGSPDNLTACRSAPNNKSGEWVDVDAGSINQFYLSKDCGKEISAGIWGASGESRDIAGGLSVTITDFALALRDPKHPYNVRDSRERQKIEEARKNKPIL
jgi:hypothetical protein